MGEISLKISNEVLSCLKLFDNFYLTCEIQMVSKFDKKTIVCIIFIVRIRLELRFSIEIIFVQFLFPNLCTCP